MALQKPQRRLLGFCFLENEIFFGDVVVITVKTILGLDVVRINSYSFAMKLLSAFWRYWKWVCVALMTSFVVLALLAAALQFFKSPSENRKAIEGCLDRGGTWDDGEGLCKAAA